MDIVVREEHIYDVEADAVVAVVFSDQEPGGDLAELDEKLGGKISELIKSGEISGKNREFTMIHNEKIKSPRVLIMGLGKRKEFDIDKIRSISGRAARILRRINALKMAYSSFTGLGIDPELSAQCITEGVLLGLYHFKKFVTSKTKKPPIEQIAIVAKKADDKPAMERGIEKGKILADATILARDLANEPANYMTPTYFAGKAQEVAKEFGIEINVIEEDEMTEKGMGGLLAVTRGSAEPAKMVVMKYTGKPGAPYLGLVGKGITFDSGGLCIKDGENMFRMYSDCSGACSVLGTMKALAATKLPANVIGVMPLCENMPAGNAYRPGDIITTYSGKTVEILNTDAEGRLILADGLTLAQKEGVAAVIDIATLTGGCVVALGYTASGIMGNDEHLIDEVKKAGHTASENMWQLPLYDDYFAQIYSDVADMENSGGRHASPCTAGKFLEQFINEGTPWVHIDIAGTAMIERERTPYLKKPYLPKEGATGVGVRSMYHLVEQFAAEH